MVASLVRLLHSGPQDERLLPRGPRDIRSYIRVFYRVGRMTTQWHRLDFQQVPQFGTTTTCRLLRKGELLTRLYLVVTMPDIYTIQKKASELAGPSFVGPRFGWTNSLGHALIQSLTLEIGGMRVDAMDGRLLEVLDEFNTPLEKVVNRNAMIGRIQDGYTETSLGWSSTPMKVVVPLPFWFSNGDLGAALPIDSLNVDEVRVSLTFRPLTSVYYTNSRASTQVPIAEGSALWPMLGSSFYKLDTNGSVVPGLWPQPNGFVSPIIDVQMPQTLQLGDTYLLAEYVYLDKPEANRFRISEIEIPILQHLPQDPQDTRGFPMYQVPFQIANPTRHLYCMAQNYLASSYNAHFLCTRDLSGTTVPYAPWWPDCKGLSASYSGYLSPGFSTRGSEPLSLIELVYEGKYTRTSTENCALYRSILPSLEERKSPWINRYMYCIPFGVQSGYTPGSTPLGEANMNRIMKKELRLGFTQPVQRMWIYSWAETYNVLKIYGGRGTMLFSF